MVNKIIPLILMSFLLIACDGGAKIDFTKPEIEQLGEGTLSEGVTSGETTMSGTLVRSSQNDGADKVITNGKSYQVGKYTSAGAYSFIQARALGSSTSVKVKGSTNRDSGYAPNPSSIIDVINIEVITE